MYNKRHLCISYELITGVSSYYKEVAVVAFTLVFESHIHF
jgi:hypothetical protein